MATRTATGLKLDFTKFKDAVSHQFQKMVETDLYRTDVNKDEMWETYLASFPAGTNPIFRERSEHDCSCCRQFVGAVGNAVAIVNGKLVSIWDCLVNDPNYQEVADAMARLVKSRRVCDVFLYPEKHAGTDRNYENDDGSVRTWTHFHVNIPHRSNTGKNFYCDGKELATKLGDKRATHDVLLRGLTELTEDAIDTVLEIIGQGSLYRGSDYKHSLTQFAGLHKQCSKLKTDVAKDLFAWSHVDVPEPISRIRNTAIGTLLIDLSEGTDLEDAVRKFETSIMAPSNYKRPTALVSQKMVENAKKTVEDLGLTSALERRYATLSDVSVNNIIFADRNARKAMKGGAFDDIATKSRATKSLDKVETISIEDFIANVVPKVDSIEVMFENKHVNNLVSVIAPIHKDAKRLFKWDNGFSWAYNGDVTDSIKERVKRAGGNVEGDVCCRLAWFNTDDLDLHMIEPKGPHIHFGSKISAFTGGQLDVDMNVHNLVRDPVENIFYKDHRRMTPGEYQLYVHNFTKRESKDVGFEVECDLLGDVYHFSYDKAVRDKQSITVMRFIYHKGSNIIQILESLPSSKVSKNAWGLKTQEFHRVNVFMLSPNYWDDERGSGNKHYIFMLDGCVNDGQPRGFFNEYLRPELDKHRKVLEIVGGKLRVQESANQLSGLGFSDTKRDEILVRVKGNFTRTLKVTI